MDNEWNQFYESGRDALRNGNFKAAESMWLSALGLAGCFGEKDPRMVLTLEYLLDTYWYLGDFAQVESLSRRLLNIYRATLEPEHFRMAKVAHRLATLYHFQQKFGFAEPLYKQVISIMMKWLGSKHPELARVMDDYADLLKSTHRDDQGDYIKQCAMAIKAGKWGQLESKTSGPGSEGETELPPGADRPAGAFIRAIQKAAVPGAVMTGAAEAALSTPVPVTAPKGTTQNVSNVSSASAPTSSPPAATSAPSASNLNVQAARSQQEALSSRASQDRVSSQTGPQQSQYDTGRHDWEHYRALAEKAMAGEDFDSAEKLWLAAVKAAEKMGVRDQRYVYCLDNLADILARLEKYYLAEPHLKRSHEIKRDVLGDAHPIVAAAANNLAKLHYLQGHYREAEQYGRSCIETYERALGPAHPDVASSAHNLATLYHMQCKYGEAESYYKKGLSIRRKSLGDDHPDTLRIQKNYADLLRTLNRIEEAEALSRKATGLITGEWSAIEIATDGQVLPR